MKYIDVKKLNRKSVAEKENQTTLNKLHNLVIRDTQNPREPFDGLGFVSGEKESLHASYS